MQANINWACNVSRSVENLALAETVLTITLDKWSKIQTNAKEWKGLDKFGAVWDTTNWEDGQQGRFMHNSCYITLCSSKKREQAIIRDAKAREAAKKILKSTSQSPVYSDLHPTSPLQKRARLSTGFILKKINVYGAWKRRTRNSQTVRPVNSWGLDRAPGGRILKDTFHF